MRYAPFPAVARPNDARGENHVCIETAFRSMENQRCCHGFAFRVVALYEIWRKERLLGEAYGLRGYFYYLLFRQWGGVPRITTPIDPGDEAVMKSIKRASAEDTVKGIVDDLEEAAKHLPAKHDDTNFGRITSLVAKVAISQVKLLWASPLWNPEGGPDHDARWEAAATAAKDAYDLALENGHVLEPNYANLFKNTIPSEYIWTKNSVISECFFWDYYHFPTGFGGAYNVEGPLQEMIDALFDSGVMDSVMVADETGHREFRSFDGQNTIDFIDEIINKPNFDEVLNIFRTLDNSKLLARVVPALVTFFKSTDTNGNIEKYLPLSWDEICEFKWGYECYVLFDFLHKTATIDRDFLKAVLIKAGTYVPAEGQEVKKLEQIISEHADDFCDLIVGKMNTAGELIDVDSSGRTVVFKNGKRLEGKNYCLFDMMLFEKALPRILDQLFDLPMMDQFDGKISSEDISDFGKAVQKLNIGKVLVNYKKEFHSVLDVVATLGKDVQLVEAFSAPNGLNSFL